MYYKYYLTSCFFAFFISGCSLISLSNPDIRKAEFGGGELAKHVISIDPDGKLKDPASGELKVPEEWTKYFNNIIDGIARFPKNKDGQVELLIYIHGGLNGEAGALKRVKNKYQFIKNDGKYPIFINWRSGPVTTYYDHLWSIRQGEISSTAWLTSPVYLLTDIGKSLVNAPESWLVSGEHMLRSTIKKKSTIETELYEQVKTHNCRDKVDVSYTGSNYDSWGFKRSLEWFITSPSKVITTPFTYTMAKPAWDIMLRRTDTLFYTPCDLRKGSEEKSEKCDQIIGSKRYYSGGGALKNGTPGRGALYRFLSMLEKKDLGVKITLLGHSMGAIIVNNIVNLGLELEYDNIVHMASADSIDNLFNKVLPYIASNKGSQFYSLSLHPDNENRESSALGLTPSGSLLSWIDNMYTVPKTNGTTLRLGPHEQVVLIGNLTN